MNKLIFGFLMTLMATPMALASRARLEALGQDPNGSYFLQDSRNIFLNPAVTVTLPNQLNLEMGDAGITGNPKAEGGLIHTGEQGSYGLNLGRIGMGAQHILDVKTDLAIDLMKPENAVELIYAKGFSDLNLGLNLLYANASSDTGETNNLPDKTASVMTLTVGASKENMDFYLSYGLSEKSKTEDLASVTKEFDSSSSVKLGGVYKFSEEIKLSLETSMLNYKFNTGAGLTGSRGIQNLSVNFYNALQTNSDLFIFYTMGLTQNKKTIDYELVSANDVESATLDLPIVLGAESQVKDWLNLRASVKQSTIINSKDYKNGSTNLKTDNAVNTTTVAAGLTLTFGKVSLDGLFEGATQGKINGNQFIAEAALKYMY